MTSSREYIVELEEGASVELPLTSYQRIKQACRKEGFAEAIDTLWDVIVGKEYPLERIKSNCTPRTFQQMEDILNKVK
jgi:hypothetical protein